jgi:hypothetical protein
MRSGTYILMSLSERMRYRYLPSPKLVRILLEAYLFNQLDISGIDIPFVLTNEDRRIGQSIHWQPVTLYLTVIVSPILPIGTSNLQSTEVNESLPREDTSSMAQDPVNTTRSVGTSSEALPPPADYPPGDTSSPLPPGANLPVGISLAKNALQDAKDAMTTINLSDTLGGVLERIKWVMDTLGPIAEVRINVIFANPLLSPSLSSAQPVCKDGTWSTSRDPQGDPFVLLLGRNAYVIFGYVDTLRTVSA